MSKNYVEKTPLSLRLLLLVAVVSFTSAGIMAVKLANNVCADDINVFQGETK